MLAHGVYQSIVMDRRKDRMAKGNCNFDGTGAQYFVPVIVHLFLLSVITFGIYSPWALVRLFKLKASHTTIDGKSVSFNGTGGQLLVLAFVHGLLTIITFGFYGPWAICRIFDWKAQNTLVGGKPSEFKGSGGSLFLLYLIHLVILPLLTFGLYYLVGIYRLYAWKEEHTLYGGERTSFGAGLGESIKISLITWISNIVTLNLFTPWAICMLHKWQMEGLKVGDSAEVEHFPPVRTNMLAVGIPLTISFFFVFGTVFVMKSLVKNQARQLAKMMEISQLDQLPGKHNRPRKVSRSKNLPASSRQYQRQKVRNTVGLTEKHHQTQPGIYQTELKKIDQVLGKDKKNADAFYNRGWLMAKMGNSHQAEKEYTRAIEIDRKYRDAYYNRGLLYAKQKKFDQAVRDFAVAIKLDPKATDAYCNRGNANHKLGKSRLAIGDYTAAIRMAPQDADLYYNRALVYTALNEKEQADKDLKKAAQLGYDRPKIDFGLPGGRKIDSTDADKSAHLISQVKWDMDIGPQDIPDAPAGGMIHGQQFSVESAKIENGILTLRQGGDFFADRSFMIFLFLKEGESLEGKVFRVTRESGFGSPHIHMKWKKDKKNLPETKVFTNDYAMQLEFGHVEDGRLAGRLYLSLPDDKKSYTAGRFTAEVKKL
jgi:uncharacterized membrane protein YjgN (DUF898 family)/Tfp pilus assembly protein PilF